MSLQESLVLITSLDPSIAAFGTGFVIQKKVDAVYVLTCARVVEDVGGESQIEVDRYPATVEASGVSEGIDLAVLRVEALWHKPVLPLRLKDIKSKHFITEGYQLFNRQDRISRPLKGVLGESVSLMPSSSGERVQAWDLQIDDTYALKPGYSGSPVVLSETGEVVAIVSHRQNEGKSGLALSVRAIERFWRIVDIENIYEMLLRLGYRRQAQLFTRIVNKHSVAAVLIHGPSEHGQRWLLNRLVSKHIPDSLVGRKVLVELKRKARRSDALAIWRELGNRTGLRGPERLNPESIAQRIYQWWRTQDVLLVLHDVDCVPEKGLRELIDKFWLPIAEGAKASESGNDDFKLYLFLVDYEGQTAEWDLPFVEKLDLTWTPQRPIKSPKLASFSYNELENWIYDEFDDLPGEITNDIDDTVNAILDNSEGGVPEQVMTIR